MKNVAWTVVPDHKKESKEGSILIWTNFDSFAIKYLIYIDYFKNYIFR